MDFHITKEQLPPYLKLPKTFDWTWVDQEPGFDKVFAIVPEETYTALKTTHEEIFRLLTKAAVHYAFVLDIPRAKVMLTNFGIDQPNQDKSKPAPWWDVRDLGLKYLKTADQSFSKALTLIAKVPTIVDTLPFFADGNKLISTPAAFEAIYSINHSPEVYRQLVPLMDRAAQSFIYQKLLPCASADIEANSVTANWLKNALAFYALHYAAELPVFTFLNNSVVVQYEELPWQKSIVLNDTQRARSGQTFLNMANENIENILRYVRAEPEIFPCYQQALAPDYSAQKRKSGLYLI